MRIKPRRRGFTILELLIVIGILLAIGSLVAVNVLGASEKADLKLARAQLQAFESAIEQFRVEMKRWPTEEEGLAVLWSKEALANDDDKAKYGGPYLKEPKPKDTWGNVWVFRCRARSSRASPTTSCRTARTARKAPKTTSRTTTAARNRPTISVNSRAPAAEMQHLRPEVEQPPRSSR